MLRPWPAAGKTVDIPSGQPKRSAGPGSKFLAVGGVDFIHSASDARFLLWGGRFVGETALLRFYVLHWVALPLAAALLIAVHFWRVRKDGGMSGAL